jgi:hypothetical protein
MQKKESRVSIEGPQVLLEPNGAQSGSARVALETTLKLKGVSQIVQPTTARSSLYAAASDSEVLRGRARMVLETYWVKMLNDIEC